MRRTALVSLTLLLCFVPLLDAGVMREAEAVAWLRQHKILPRPGEHVFRAKILTIVAASKRMVVKHGDPEKTMVLSFSEPVKVIDDGQKLAPADLARGDKMIVIVRSTGTVREIHLDRQ